MVPTYVLIGLGPDKILVSGVDPSWILRGGGDPLSLFERYLHKLHVIICFWPQKQIIIVCLTAIRIDTLWKCIDFKCVRKPTNSRLTRTMQKNPAAEQNLKKQFTWSPRVRGISPTGEEKICLRVHPSYPATCYSLIYT